MLSFHVKFVQTDRRIDGQTNGRTDRRTTVKPYAPDLSIRGIKMIGRLVVLGFNANLNAKVISWRSVTHICFLAFSHQYLHNFSFQSHRLLFSHVSAEVRGEKIVASTGNRTHNHQVISPTRSPLNHPSGASLTCNGPARCIVVNESHACLYVLTLSETSPLFYMSEVQVF